MPVAGRRESNSLPVVSASAKVSSVMKETTVDEFLLQASR